MQQQDAAAHTLLVHSDPWLRRFLSTIVVAMTLTVMIIAGGAFFISFEAISAYANTSGGINPQYSYLAPLFVDSFIFVASCADLWFTTTRSDRDGWRRRLAYWWPKLLLGVAAAGSFALNLAHASSSVSARAIAGLAPTALVLTFEILMAIVRRAVAARMIRLNARAETTVQPAHPPLYAPRFNASTGSGGATGVTTGAPARPPGPRTVETPRPAARAAHSAGELVARQPVSRPAATRPVAPGDATGRAVDAPAPPSPPSLQPVEA